MKDCYELDIIHSKNYYRYNVFKMRNNFAIENCLNTDSKAKLKLFMDLRGLKIIGFKSKPYKKTVFLDFDNNV